MNEMDLTLENINILRYALDEKNDEADKVVKALIDRKMTSGSNDYLLAQYALIAGHYWGQGHTEEGRYYIKRVGEFVEYAVDRVSLIDAYILLGNYATLDEHFNDALEWYMKALDLSNAIDYKRQIARIYNNIGFIYQSSHQYEKGLEYMLKAEQHTKRYSDNTILSTLYNNIVEIYIKFKSFDKVRHYLDLMDLILHDNRTTIYQLNYLINKWHYVLHLDDLFQAEVIAKEARKLLRQLPYGNDHILCNLAIFDLLIKMGRTTEAIESLERDISKMESSENYYYLKRYYDKLIQYYSEFGDDNKRMDYIEKRYCNDILLGQHKNRMLQEKLAITEAYHIQEKQTGAEELDVDTLSVENLRLLAVNNNLRAIHNIGVSILSTTDLEEIYDILMEKVDGLFKIQEFAIGIIDDSKTALRINYSSQYTGVRKKTVLLPLESPESLAVKSYVENKEILINDCQLEDPIRYERNLKRGEKLSSLLFLPIEINNKPIGVMTVQHSQKNAFSSLHLEVFRLLATFASVSFKNAQHNMKLTEEIDKRADIQNELEEINTQLNYLARHDDLTGVYNRRTFEKVYKDSFDSARLHGEFLSVMILDIDYFKQYNDHYGHLQGDECIARVAVALKQALKRQNDFVARYGGDEFMILLPNTDRQGAEIVADMLVQAIRDIRIPHEGSKVSDVVTISLGAISKQITSEVDSDALLIAADNALYKTKKELGRNAFHLL
jgi:diguanylate cyclase (GGDEF)-like protein